MVFLIPKSERMCIPKKPRLEKDSNSWKILLSALDDYRERRKYNRCMKMKPFIDYLHPYKRKDDFIQFCKELEDMRCETLAMNKHRFYKLVAEFSLVPNGMKYYNPKNLFGCDSSWDADEFKNRIYETMPNISHAVALSLNGREDMKGILEFIKSVDDLNTVVDVKSSGVLKSKDWFCIAAFRNKAAEKAWSEEEVLQKVKTYYRRNVKKVYPERLLNDLVKGEFDRLVLPQQKKKIKKDPVIHSIENEGFYKKWANERLF